MLKSNSFRKLPRREGLAKLSGVCQYLSDTDPAEDWWGVTVRSSIARGRLIKVHFDPGFDWSCFVRVLAKDVPGQNVGGLFDGEQPVLVIDEILHYQQPIALLAHRSQSALREALSAIHVECEPLPAYLDFRELPTAEQQQADEQNILCHTQMESGESGRILDEATHIIEGIYDCGAQEHLYLETQAMRAVSTDEGIHVAGSLQCPGYVQNSLCRVLGLSPEHVRVSATPLGGGFGGKEDYPSILACHAALLARASGHPVRMIYDRQEDMHATTRRHAAQVRHRTAVSEQGDLLAMEVDILLDGGAYATLSPIVLNRATLHACGPYLCEHVRVTGRARRTNTLPSGAFRGFGNPQVHFAIERHMDRIANELGLDRVELRRRNLLVDGDALPTGQIIADGVDTPALLHEALDRSSFGDKSHAHQVFNSQHVWRKRGLGLACSFHGAGLPVAVEQAIASQVVVQGRPDGTVTLLTSIVEMGQGSDTVFTGLVAESLGFEAAEVDLAPPDLALMPDSGPSVASRTSMVVGQLILAACDDLKRVLGLPGDSRGDAVRRGIRTYFEDHKDSRLIGRAKYANDDLPDWNAEKFKGTSYPAFSWAAQVAEVEVDLRTGEVTLLDIVSVQDVGTVLNPVLAEGQVQGGVAQAVGWALTERVVLNEGVMSNANLVDYAIPTACDLPDIQVAFIETPSPHGAKGSRGLGELPMVGPAAAIANAASAALNTPLDTIPLVPETLLDKAGPQ